MLVVINKFFSHNLRLVYCLIFDVDSPSAYSRAFDMEHVILYPGVEEDIQETLTWIKFEEIHAPAKLETGEINVRDSTESPHRSKKEQMVSIEHALMEVDSASDMEEDFHTAVERRRMQNKRVETININPPIVESGIHKTPRTAHSLRLEDPLLSLCRLCAIPCNNMIYIFGPTILHKSIQEKIQQCLPITVKNTDTLSKQVCQLCLQKLETCHQFYTSVTLAEQQLLVFHEQTSGGRVNRTEIGSQTSLESSGLRDVIKNTGNERQSVRNFYRNLSSTNSNDRSNLGKRVGRKNSSCKNQSTAPEMKKLDSKQNSQTRETVHLKEKTNSKKDVSGSVKNPRSTSRESNQQVASEMPSYYLRKRKFEKCKVGYNSALSSGNANKSQAPAHQSIRAQIIKCHLCGDIFRTIQKCRNHASVHASTNYYPCCFCDQVVATDKDWKKHWSQHDVNRYNQKLRPTTLLHGCNVCGKNFASQARLQCHKLYHAPRVSSAHCRKKCDQLSDLQASLPQQKKVAPKKSTISSCKTSGTQSRESKIDQKKVEYTFQCTFCKLQLGSNVSWDDHKKGCRVLKGNFLCRFCNQLFTQENLWTVHEQSHTGQRFTCDLCTKTFCTKVYRDYHRRIHTGERPADCVICGERFAFPQQLHRHQTNFH